MKNNVKRYLAVFLCVVMVLCMLPYGTASAAEITEARKTMHQPKGKPVQSRNIDSYGVEHYFTTYEDLKTLVGMSYSDVAYAVYTGSDALTVQEDLVVPANLVLVINGELVIPAGVFLDVYYLFADQLTVAGDIQTYYAEIYNRYDVSGTHYNLQELYLVDTGYRAGLENLVQGDYAYSCIYSYPQNTAQLKSELADVKAAWDYGWYGQMVITELDFVLTEDVTVPETCDIIIALATMTVAEGVTMTLDGYMWVYDQLIVDGTLVVNGSVDIWYYDGGSMTVNGSCQGYGAIYTNSPSIADSIFGLKGYSSSYDPDGYWILTLGAGDEDVSKLSAPTDLEWGYDHDLEQARPGSMSWKSGDSRGSQFEIAVYWNGDIYETYTWNSVEMKQGDWGTMLALSLGQPESGEYYFTVTAQDAEGNYSDSDAVVSDIWYYTAPSKAVGAPTNLAMDANGMRWTNPADTSSFIGYEVIVEYSATGAADLAFSNYLTVYETDPDVGYPLTEIGWYSYSVRLLSADITKAHNSDFVKLGEPYYYNGNGDNNTGDDNLDDDENTGSEIFDLPFNEYEWEVLKIVNRERRAEGLAPLTMYELIQVAADIRTLEIQESFSHTRPNGTSCFTVFDEIGLTYWSAGENIAWGYRSPEEVMVGWMNSSGHRANIMKSGFAHIGIGYDNRSWVQLFTSGGSYSSIDVLIGDDYTVLAGTTFEEMGLVAVLESSMYGTCYLPIEEYYCTGYDPNQPGTQQVKLSVLGQTTVFEITVEGDPIGPDTGMEGDFNGDGTVNDADVAYLLWHTLFADQYPIDINGDVNNDGVVNDADVAYLLWHTLFPEQYPIG